MKRLCAQSYVRSEWSPVSVGLPLVSERDGVFPFEEVARWHLLSTDILDKAYKWCRLLLRSSSLLNTTFVTVNIVSW